MAGSYDTYSVAPRPAWRKYKARSDDVLPTRLQAHNNEAPFIPYGEVLSGTLLMYADGSYPGVRPLPLQTIEDAIVSGNVANVADAANFYLLDTIDIVAGVDSFDEVTFVAGASGAEIKVTADAPGNSRLRVDLVDPGGATQPLTVTVVDDGTNITVTVSLATDGGSVITSTVTDVIDILNTGASAGLLEAALDSGLGAELAVDVGPSALAGGALVGEVLVNARQLVTPPVKTSTPNTITFDGAAVDVPAGAVIQHGNLDGYPELLAGILEDQVDTAYRRAGETVAKDWRVTVAIAGTISVSQVTGWDDALTDYIAGGEVSAGVLGQGTASAINGFVLSP